MEIVLILVKAIPCHFSCFGIAVKFEFVYDVGASNTYIIMRHFVLLDNLESINSVPLYQLYVEIHVPLVLFQRFSYRLISKIGRFFEMMCIVMSSTVWGYIRPEL